MGIFDIFKKKENIVTIEEKECCYSKITVFDDWMDDVLKNDFPSEVKAISFCIYEDKDNLWSIELNGAKSYDKEDDDWACDFNSVYNTRNNTFFMKMENGDEWENEEEYITKAEASYTKMIKNYLKNGKYSDKLKSYDVIAVGTTDGDLNYIYEKNNIF